MDSIWVDARVRGQHFSRQFVDIELTFTQDGQSVVTLEHGTVWPRLQGTWPPWFKRLEQINGGLSPKVRKLHGAEGGLVMQKAQWRRH